MVVSLLSRNNPNLTEQPDGQDIAVSIDPLYNPDSEQFNPPTKDDAKSLVNFLLAEQQQAFGRTFLDVQDVITYPILIRNVKAMLKTYSPLDVKRSVVLCCRKYDKFPGSTKTMKRALEQWNKQKS